MTRWQVGSSSIAGWALTALLVFTSPALGANSPPSSLEPLVAVQMSNSRIDLSWQDSQGEDWYWVYLWSNQGRQQVATLPANTTSYSVTGLSGVVTYFFQVEAVNKFGRFTSDWRTPQPPKVERPPPGAMPSPPTPLEARVASITQIDLSWTNSAREDGYRLFQQTNASWQKIKDLPADATAYSVHGLQPGKMYSFKVEAFNRYGFLSAAIHSVMTKVAPPTSPEPLRLNAVSSTQINLHWTDSVGEDYYLVYQASKYGVVQKRQPADTTIFAARELMPETTYIFWVEACRLGAHSSKTAKKSATTLPTLTSPAPLFARPKTTTRIDLSWTDCNDETGYRIFWWMGMHWIKIADVPAGVTTYSATGLSPGTFYSFQVEAYRNWETTSASASASTYPGNFRSPAPFIAYARSRTEISLTWKDAGDEDKYVLHYGVNNTGYRTITLPANTTSFSLTGLTPDSPYFFYLLAYRGNNSLSARAAATTKK